MLLNSTSILILRNVLRRSSRASPLIYLNLQIIGQEIVVGRRIH